MQHGSIESRAAKMAADLQTSCLGVRVGRLNRIVGRRFEQALRPLGLSVAQMEILGALILNPAGLRPADLATWLAVERSTMSRNLALMEQRGYIATTETTPTGRSHRVAITADGRTALANADEAWKEAQGTIAAQLGDDALPILDGWLTALAR